MIVLVPAYGRMYKSKKELMRDWEGGKDFMIQFGPYCSIRDKDSMIKEFGAIELVYGVERELSYYINKKRKNNVKI